MKKKTFLLFAMLIFATLTLTGCGKKELKVTFDSDGGSFVSSQTVKKNEMVIEPTDPIKDDYSFDHWELDGKEYNFSNKVTKNITLKAIWNALGESTKFTVTFDTNGGTKVESVTVNENEKVSVPNKPSKRGYVFVEWQLNGVKYNFDKEVTEDIKLVAKWNKVISDNTNKKPDVKPNEKPNKPNVKPDKPVKPDAKPDKPAVVEVSSITLSVKDLTLTKGETGKITATINPNNATNKTVTWTTSDAKVATVDANGNVNSVGAGSATITAKAGNKTATVTVTVKNPITYSVVWEDEKNSTIGQSRLFIQDSEGNKVNGVVTLTTIDDKTTDVNVTTAGSLYLKSVIKNATIKSTNK